MDFSPTSIEEAFVLLLKEANKGSCFHYGLFLPATHPWSIACLCCLDDKEMQIVFEVTKMKKKKGQNLVRNAADGFDRLLNMAELSYTSRLFTYSEYQDKVETKKRDQKCIWIKLGVGQRALPLYEEPRHLSQPPRRISLKPFVDQLKQAIKQEMQPSLSRSTLSSAAPLPELCFSPDNPGMDESATIEYRHKMEEHEMIFRTINQFLLPKIFKREQLASRSWWRKPESFDKDAADIIIKLGQDLRKKREERSAMAVSSTMMSPLAEAKSLHALQKFGIDPSNTWSVSTVLRNLVTLEQSKRKYDLFNVQMGNSTCIRLCRIPKSRNMKCLRENERDHPFLDNILKQFVPDSCSIEREQDHIDEEENEDEVEADGLSSMEHAAAILLAFVGNRYPEAMLSAASSCKNIVVAKPMSVIETTAMLCEAGLNTTQAEIIASHLCVHFGRTVMAGRDKIRKELLVSRSLIPPPTTSSLSLSRSRSVEWFCRDIVETLKTYVISVVKQSSKIPQFHSIDLLWSCDHGQGASRGCLCIITRWIDGDKHCERSEPFLVARAKCRKDTYEILSKTFMPHINQAIAKIIEAGSISVWQRRATEGRERAVLVTLGDETVSNEWDPELRHVPIQCISSGDGSQIMTNYGREGYSSCWCWYCDQSKAEWSQVHRRHGRMWTLQSMAAHRNVLKSSSAAYLNSANNVRGFKTDQQPLLCVEVKDTAPPILHLLLGLGNKVHDSLISQLQSAAEQYTEQYVALETATYQQQDTVASIAEANRSTQLTGPAQQQAKDKLKAAKEKLKLIKQQWEKEAQLPANSKATGQPLRAWIEDVLKKHGIKPAIYHGGDLQGNSLRALLRNRREIFASLWNECLLVWIGMDDSDVVASQDTIKTVLDGYERLLGHLDAVFSLCSIKRYHPTSLDYERLAKQIKQSSYMWRALGLSITPKFHFVEDHLLASVRYYKGVGDLTEEQGERVHQTGLQAEARTKSLNHQSASLSHIVDETISKLPQVRAQVAKVQERKRQNRKEDMRRDENSRQKKLKRDDDRNDLLSLPLRTDPFPCLKSIRIDTIKTR